MSLGTLLRRRRKELKLTLRAVAEKAGLSEGFMSQVENSVKSPSVETLMTICRALDIEAGEVLSRLENSRRLYQIKREEWSDVDFSHTGFATRRFCPPEDRETIDSALLFLEPSKGIPVRKNARNSQEVLCVLKGTLELLRGEERLELEAGDAVHLWTDTGRQQITNIGRYQAVVLWVGTI